MLPPADTQHRCDCAHGWKRVPRPAKDFTTRVVYRCVHCDARLFRQPDARDGEYYAMWCDQNANPPSAGICCSWPLCVAAERPLGKRVGDAVRKVIWELAGTYDSWERRAAD